MGRIGGDITVMPVADVVIWLANRGHCGTLTIRDDEREKTFDLEKGMAVRATSNLPREYFGQFLLHFGLLTEDQLQRAFDTQRETSVLLGRILVMINIIPEEQVIQSLRVKISESLLECFKWKAGEFEFVDDVAPRSGPKIEVAVPLIDLHAEGMMRDEVWRRFERVFPTSSHIANVDETKVPRGSTPDNLDGRILELCRAGLSVEEMTLELHATDYQIAAALLSLFDLQLISPAEPTTALPIPQAFLEERIAMDANQPSRDAVPHVTRLPSYDERRALTAKQRYILARVDGKRTVQAIIQVSPMHDLEALEILRDFEDEQIIRLA